MVAALFGATPDGTATPTSSIRRCADRRCAPGQAWLGLPTWSDKLLAEVVRMLLNACYHAPPFRHNLHPGRLVLPVRALALDEAAAWPGNCRACGRCCPPGPGLLRRPVVRNGCSEPRTVLTSHGGRIMPVP